MSLVKALNTQFLDDLKAGRPLRLNLGCGRDPKSGYYGVDLVEMDGVDIVADLNAGMSWLPDNSVDEIITFHVFEHIQGFLPLMRELHRVVKPDGRISITVPHFSNVFGFSDPTHVRFFGMYSMFYFVPPEFQPKRKVPVFYTDIRFSIESIFIDFYREGLVDRILGKLMSKLVNRSLDSQHFYEHRLASMYHAREITYVMRPMH